MKPQSKEDLLKLASLIAEKTTHLVEETIGRSLPIGYLTIFSHTPTEYERFVAYAHELGESSDANNGLKFNLHEPLKTQSGAVSQLRIRKPDVYRSQLGCADFTVEECETFKT
jgi:hypothetical protein